MDRESFLLISMSMEDAKVTLGLPPHSVPTPNEIKDAYLQKAKVLHPDVGGDLEQMKELNIAKDILEGKARPTYDRREEAYPRRETTPPRQEPKKIEVTFEEAKSKAGIPSGVEWFFVTDFQRGTQWSSDESARGDTSFVAYGRTTSQHVFVAVNHAYAEYYYVGGGPGSDIWTIQSTEYPIKDVEGTNPAWLYGNVVKALKHVTNARFNSKVMDAKGWGFSAKIPTTSVTSIKHWLVNSGQVSGESPSVAGRKHVVELVYHQAFKDTPGFYKDPMGLGDPAKITLLINGKPYDLSETDFNKFMKLRTKGHRLLEIIFGRYYYDGSHKQLTKIKGGKQLLVGLADLLTDLPSEARNTLRAASEQMK